MKRVLVLVTLALVVAGAAVAGSINFSPRLATGTWMGTWSNTAFGSTGTVGVTIRAQGRAPKQRLRISIDFSGQVFGCEDPPPITFTVPRGQGANRWNPRSLRLKSPISPFGAVDITFDFRNARVRGGGSAPPCRPGISWAIVPGPGDELTVRHIHLTLEITLEDGSKATSMVELIKG
jgi:hypothetical protein